MNSQRAVASREFELKQYFSHKICFALISLKCQNQTILLLFVLCACLGVAFLLSVLVEIPVGRLERMATQDVKEIVKTKRRGGERKSSSEINK